MINKDIQLSEKNKFVLRMILVSEIEFYQAAIHTEIRKTGRKALRVGGVVKQVGKS